MKPPVDPVDFKELHSTVTQKGKRKWVYALKPEGKWYNNRSILSYFYLIAFFTMPFIVINGNPLFKFDISKGEFYFFTVLFTPQDFAMFGLGMLIFIFIVIIFSMIFGRLFCGWVCPQTIFLEMVFRKIEFWIEGNGNKQYINDHKNWNNELIIRKVIKHLIFLFISFLISNTFLLYIIGRDDWFHLIQDPIKNHFGGFIAIIIFTIVFYSVFAFVREIVCTVVCPYGRLQGVLVDKNTLSVSYDYKRGEPRTKHKTDHFGGDCIDCNLCVMVCPTAIDIRNGSSQLECTQCSACIDACNLMMNKIKRPLGLIKYASVSNIEENAKFSFTPRIKTFSGILGILILALTTILVTRDSLDVTILKVSGQILRDNPDGSVSNLYTLKLTNKSTKDLPFALKVDGTIGTIENVGTLPEIIKANSKIDCLFFITLPKDHNGSRKTNVRVKLLSNGIERSTKNLDFIRRL